MTINGYDQILVFVDYLTKTVKLVPCKSTDDSAAIAQIFSNTIWRNFGLPDHIISDRDPRFISKVWASFCKTLGIERKLSTSHHPQTDGSTEEKNHWISECLRSFCSYKQNDWDQFLHIVEFGINDTRNSSTGYTPFYLLHGQHPKNLLSLSNHTPSLDAQTLQSLLSVVRDKIQIAQNRQAEIANRHRIESPFQVGDLVLISTTDVKPPNLRDRPSEKLSSRYSGPFKIIGKQGINLELELPKSWRIHRFFHPEKLRPYFWDSSQPHPLSNLPISERTLESLLAKRTFYRRTQYLVKWLNHHPIFNVWMDSTSLPSHFITAFESEPQVR
jgi:hypothetical protein